MQKQTNGFTKTDLLLIFALLIGATVWGARASSDYVSNSRDDTRKQVTQTINSVLTSAIDLGIQDNYYFRNSQILEDFLITSGMTPIKRDKWSCYYYGYSNLDPELDYFVFTYAEDSQRHIIVNGSRRGEATVLTSDIALRKVKEKTDQYCLQDSVAQVLPGYTILPLPY